MLQPIANEGSTTKMRHITCESSLVKNNLMTIFKRDCNCFKASSKDKANSHKRGALNNGHQSLFEQ